MTDKSRSFKHAEGSSKDAESSSLARDFYWIVCAYVVALIVAGIALAVFDAWGPLWRAAWADVAATLAIFAFGYAFKILVSTMLIGLSHPPCSCSIGW